eukprot:g18038.t1
MSHFEQVDDSSDRVPSTAFCSSSLPGRSDTGRNQCCLKSPCDCGGSTDRQSRAGDNAINARLATSGACVDCAPLCTRSVCARGNCGIPRPSRLPAMGLREKQLKEDGRAFYRRLENAAAPTVPAPACKAKLQRHKTPPAGHLP